MISNEGAIAAAAGALPSDARSARDPIGASSAREAHARVRHPRERVEICDDAAWTGPARMWLGRARSRLPPTRRSRPRRSRSRAAPPLDSTARVCRVVPLAERVAVPRAPTLAAKSPSALSAGAAAGLSDDAIANRAS